VNSTSAGNAGPITGIEISRSEFVEESGRVLCHERQRTERVMSGSVRSATDRRESTGSREVQHCRGITPHHR